MTTSRADAGIYSPLLGALAAEQDWHVICFAGGSHHTVRFGRTVDDLTDIAGVELVTVNHMIEGDSPVDVASATGRATAAFSRVFCERDVDLVFVLGDRTEMLAASLAALIATRPIAHLHGGDLTEGAYDDACRHAITKLSHLHFPALPQHAERIAALGEEAWRIHTVGALALDTLRGFSPEPVGELGAAIGVDFSQPTIVVTFHPETLSALPPKRQIDEVLAALAPLDANLVLIGPNADVGYGQIAEALSRFQSGRRETALLPSLSPQLFWSCLSHARLLVGNSSAGILEASSFRLPVVNVGSRQGGRVHPANVLDVPIDRAAISEAIAKAMGTAFEADLRDLVNPYGDGRAAGRIVHGLRALPTRRTLLLKRWPGG